MANRVAIIDMGTNTFHLLIAESGNIIFRDREAVKVGKGGINRNIIPPDGFERALNTLTRFRSIADQYGVAKAVAFGTSAIRNAANGRELADAILKQTGIETKIINGNEEAALIYEGVKATGILSDHPALIVDIGGGSVEFILGNKNEIIWKQSFEVGGQRLLEKFQKHDPILLEEKSSLEAYLNHQLQPVHEIAARFRPTTLVGVSGTFDTLSEIYCTRNKIEYRPDDPETPFKIESFQSIYEEIIKKDRTERSAIPGMIEMRVEMIVVAVILVNHLLTMHPFRDLRVSTYSLKEGALATLTAR